jgi:hypothetical protein
MANRLDLLLHQVDIKGAYLNGELNDNEVLYMHHPPGFKPRDAGNRVLRLKKTLYGLKQSGHRWYQKLSSIFDSLVVNGRGNPWVFFLYPYPYPLKPLPSVRGKGTPLVTHGSGRVSRV